MGCAPMAHTLYTKVMRYDPAAPKWVRWRGASRTPRVARLGT